jgi:cell division protein FtsI (penicillin-binding protein 3)
MDTTVEPRALRRLTLVLWLTAGWSLIIIARLAQLQILEHESLRQMAIRQQEQRVEIKAPRGTIYSGGLGGGPLALSIPVHRVAINPSRIPEKGEAFVANVLHGLLGLDAAQLEADILEARKSAKHYGYLVIREDATPQEIERLKRSKLDIFTFEQAYRREYPKGTLASHVLGRVNFDGHGDAGVELSLDEELHGVPGRVVKLRDSRNRAYHDEIYQNERPEPGTHIYLTIDEAIQYAAEEALRKAVLSEGVPSGTIVVMSPKTGEIKAMASYPPFDPAAPMKDDSELLSRMNLAVSVPFEPGSVFKAVTVAAALETTDLRPTDIINCGNGVYRFPGRVIHDHDPYSALSVVDVLAQSSNIGAVRIALKAGNEAMYLYMRKFGFGERTGIPLPHESPGLVHPLRDWGESSIGSVAMGHELMATPLQLAQAFSIIANNGVLVRPRLIKARQKGNGAVVPVPAEPGELRIQPETAIELRRMLEQVVLNGTGKSARVKRYLVGGKTGTAQMIDPVTKKYIHRYNSSFVGMAPLTDPEIVVSVTLNASYKYGGVTSAPVFAEVATVALRTLAVRQDLSEEALPPVNKPSNPILQMASTAQPAVEPVQDGSELVEGPRVPDFTGMTLRAVMEKSASEGWAVETVGRGIARTQNPPPGAFRSSRRIRIVFQQ